MITPPLFSTGMFVTVIRMLVLMCANCPDLAVQLLKQSESEVISFISNVFQTAVKGTSYINGHVK